MRRRSSCPPAGAGPGAEGPARCASHAWVGDLEITLRAPDGRTIALANRPGPAPLGSPANDLSASRSTTPAGQPIGAIPATDVTVPPGAYRPEVAAWHVRRMPGRRWTLTVFDRLVGVSGSLVGWSLISAGSDAPTRPADDRRPRGISARTATVAGASTPAACRPGTGSSTGRPPCTGGRRPRPTPATAAPPRSQRR